MKQKASPTTGDAASKKPWRGAVPPPVPQQYRRAASADAPKDVPPVVQRRAQRIDPPRKKPASLDLEIHAHEDRDKLESRGWFSSVLIHILIFALIAMIVAPANFGGDEPSELIMTLGDAGTPGLESSFELEVADDPGEVEPVFSDEVSVSTEIAPIKPPVKKAGGGGGGQEGPRGSFYGIEATGHEFVYILDMSGSMRGSRYRMACEELVRSVGGLQPSQRFYVLLFSNGVVQMFGDKNFRPSTLAATPSNRDRLERWLKDAYGGGSTDPRDALRVALRMDPSCVFMLSDGEFKYDKPKNELFHDTEDAFDIVEAALSNAPIHAIAFQDPRSCENMKRLAQITKGKYRFVSMDAKTKVDIAKVEEELDSANRMFRTGNKDGAKKAFHQIIEQYPQTDLAWAAREKLAYMILDSVRATDGPKEVTEALGRIAAFDPNGVVSKDVQDQLFARFEKSLDPKENNQQLVMALADCYKESSAKSASIERLGRLVLNLARDELKANRRFEAHSKFELVSSRFPNTPAARLAGDESRQIVETILDDADQIRKAKGNVAFVKHLRGLIAKNYSKTLSSAASERLNTIQKEMMAMVRDSRRNRDVKATTDAVTQLNEAFSSKAVMNMRKVSAETELRARGMFRQAEKYDRPGASPHQVITRYENIGKRYPGTVAARNAAKRIKELEADATGAELTLEMLIDRN